MAIKKYYDSDCNLGVLDGKTVAVIGFDPSGEWQSAGKTDKAIPATSCRQKEPASKADVLENET